MIEPYTGARMKTVVTLYGICKGQDPLQIVRQVDDNGGTYPMIGPDLIAASRALQELQASGNFSDLTIQRFVHDGEQKVLLA